MATAKPDHDPATPTERTDRTDRTDRTEQTGGDVDLDELNRRAAEAGAKATSADARQHRDD